MCRKHCRAGLVFWFSAVLTCGSQAATATAAGDSSAPSLPAAQLVQGAMAAETRADRTDRDRLIEQALRAAPDFAPARWQAGQIRYDDQWLSVDAALDKGTKDELLTQYRKLRSQYDNSPEGRLTLARWCQKHHLVGEMTAHATQLLVTRPDDPEILKMLDLTWDKGQLIAVAELAKRKERDEKTKQAMQHWRPLIVAIRNKIDSKSTGEHDQGLEELKAIHDPASTEAMLDVFKNRPGSLCEAIHVIGQFPSQDATEALLEQAVLAKNVDVRAAACMELKTRSLFGFVPKLMASLSAPIETKFEVVRDIEGIHFQETIQRENGNATISKTLDTEVTFLIPNTSLGNIVRETYDATGSNAQMTSKSVAKYNRKLAEYNDSIYSVLENTVGAVAPREPQPWWDWWRYYTVTNTYAKPCYVDNYYNYVDVPYSPYIPPDLYTPIRIFGQPLSPPPRTCDGCLAKGTKVWTLNGPMPVEKVHVGDRVLSQSPLSGELTFKSVLDVTVGHQDFIAFSTSEGERLVATNGHIFWVSGAGWRMAKQLKVGDRLHTVSGWSEVKSLEPLEADETHNLVVADFNTYFVGDARILTHDITMPQSVTGGVPGELVAQ